MVSLGRTLSLSAVCACLTVSSRASLISFAKRCASFRHASKKFKKGSKSRVAFPPDLIAKLDNWRSLLNLEMEAERNNVKEQLSNYSPEELSARGIAFGILTFQSQSFDPIHGATVNMRVLGKTRRSARGFRSGTPVRVCTSDTVTPVDDAVILRISESSVTLKCAALNRSYLDGAELEYVLIPSSNSAILTKLDELFLDISRGKAFNMSGMSTFLAANRGRSFSIVHSDPKRKYFADLNVDQQLAVDGALNKKRPFFLIQGPPGTGKTAVIAEIILQLVHDKKKVLACAPTHVAVDNMLRQLEGKANICRLGVDNSSLLREIRDHENYGEIIELCDELENAFAKGGKPELLNRLKGRLSALRGKIEKSILEQKEVVLSTMTSGFLSSLHGCGFHTDVTVVDEAAQSLECVAWFPIMQASRCVLVGDQCQLSALVHSKKAEKEGFGRSIMEVLDKDFGSVVGRLLRRQYRMNKKIMGWSSDYFYDSQLIADESVAEQTLCEVSDIPRLSSFNEPLLMLDTFSPKTRDWKEESFKLSYRNEMEAKLVVAYVKYLVKHGLAMKDIAVISPYFAQVELLRESLDADCVNTVDAFQGQQREVVVFSLVRSNPSGFIGFLREDRRLNVAVTRARRQFLLVADSRIMRGNECLKSLYNYILKHGRVIQATNSELLRSLVDNGQSSKAKFAGRLCR